MVASALHVEGGEIESAGTGRSEEEVANLINEVGIKLLALLCGKSAENRFDSSIFDRAEFNRVSSAAPNDLRRLSVYNRRSRRESVQEGPARCTTINSLRP